MFELVYKFWMTSTFLCETDSLFGGKEFFHTNEMVAFSLSHWSLRCSNCHNPVTHPPAQQKPRASSVQELNLCLPSLRHPRAGGDRCPRDMLPGRGQSLPWIINFCLYSPSLLYSPVLFRTVIPAFVYLITCLLCQTQWAIWQPCWWPSVLLEWGSLPITYLAFSSRDSWLKGVRCFRFLGFLPPLGGFLILGQLLR